MVEAEREPLWVCSARPNLYVAFLHPRLTTTLHATLGLKLLTTVIRSPWLNLLLEENEENVDTPMREGGREEGSPKLLEPGLNFQVLQHRTSLLRVSVFLYTNCDDNIYLQVCCFKKCIMYHRQRKLSMCL